MSSTILKTAAVVACVCVAGAVPALAHHSYAMFDRTKTVTVTGTVKLFQWTNPHSYIWLVVKNKEGGDDLYGIEASAPNTLVRYGWNKRTMSPGDVVTIDMAPLSDGRKGGHFNRGVRPDGSVIQGDNYGR